MKRLSVGIVGCGAVSELFHAPALRALERAGRITVAVLVDRDEKRLARLGQFFPNAKRQAELPRRGAVQFALVATPVRWHAEQAIALMDEGIGVLCEKPMAATTHEAEMMVAASRRTGAVLAVGLVRRFLPALQTISDFCTAQTFGRLRHFVIEEGGPFYWPAATPSFFDPKQAGGGVLLDTGVHVLDTLAWWFGDPEKLDYSDDAEGGLEATCRIKLSFGSPSAGFAGTVLLSRDWKTTNAWTLEFERATVLWRAGEANRLEIRPAGSTRWLVSQVATEAPHGRAPADSYQQALTRQMLDVIECIEGARSPRVSGGEAMRSLQIIERCYALRQPRVGEEVK